MDLKVDPKLFHDFHFKVAMSLRLPDTSRKILEEFADLDVNAEAISKIVQHNQYFEHMLLNEIKSLGLKENTPKLTAAIALLGMQRVRDFVCALQLLRMVGHRNPEIEADGKLKFKASDHIKFATRTEEYVNTHRMQYGDTAYAAGLMYDVMISVGQELYEAPKTYGEYVGEIYKHGMRSARIGVEIAKSFKSFSYSKFVFAGCLIHDIGKLALDLLFPSTSPDSYQAFRNELGKKPISREIRVFAEAKRFGLSHEYYSSQMAYYFGMFRSLERPILFHHDPYILKTVNKEMYLFAALIALSSNMASLPRIPKDTNDPVIKSWLTPELADFKVDPKLLIQIMQKVAGDRI